MLTHINGEIQSQGSFSAPLIGRYPLCDSTKVILLVLSPSITSAMILPYVLVVADVDVDVDVVVVVVLFFPCRRPSLSFHAANVQRLPARISNPRPLWTLLAT